MVAERSPAAVLVALAAVDNSATARGVDLVAGTLCFSGKIPGSQRVVLQVGRRSQESADF